MKNGTFSYGMTPVAVLTKAINGERFPMTLVGSEAALMVKLVEMGIDSHLEAFTESKFTGNERRIVCDVGPKDMLVLLRRLNESDSDDAMSLRSGILTVLEIEEI